MYSSITHLPKQFAESVKIVEKAYPARPRTTYDRIIVAGLGGSALPADVVNDYLGGEPRLEVIRDYHLPPYVSERSLVFCASYSGNTEETLSVFHQAYERKSTIVVLSHGGKLKELAVENGVPFISIPENVQPRQAIGNFVTSFLLVLENSGVLSGQKKYLSELAAWMEQNRLRIEEEGKALASKLEGIVPIIYSPSELVSAARIWKIKMNENVKIPSFYNVFPEVNHNEMVGWTRIEGIRAAFIYLIPPFINPRVQRRMDVMKEILGAKIPIYEVRLKGESFLESLFEAIWVGDFTTYYMATAAGVDPAPVAMVEEFKKKL